MDNMKIKISCEGVLAVEQWWRQWWTIVVGGCNDGIMRIIAIMILIPGKKNQYSNNISYNSDIFKNTKNYFNHC